MNNEFLKRSFKGQMSLFGWITLRKFRIQINDVPIFKIFLEGKRLLGTKSYRYFPRYFKIIFPTISTNLVVFIFPDTFLKIGQ
ncbi:MAG: hypothetical protein A3J74_11055 [Elusimicrobia bacterium RIFCSPHIGHO2_02_FULL_57_9]|nr:MAG: hypothetical protein A3J74_11055 [Elusimicrobia bacterium RIFCSPHIGHO2_02_FULL_57_9]